MTGPRPVSARPAAIAQRHRAPRRSAQPGSTRTRLATLGARCARPAFTAKKVRLGTTSSSARLAGTARRCRRTTRLSSAPPGRTAARLGRRTTPCAFRALQGDTATAAPLGPRPEIVPQAGTAQATRRRRRPATWRLGGSVPLGRSAPVNSTRPSPCPPGRFCGSAGMSAPGDECDPGYFCSGGASNATEEVCPAGSFCLKGSSLPAPCPTGSFSSTSAASSCDECARGSTCPLRGQSLETPCTAGFYCPSLGATTDRNIDNLCEPGFYCPEGVSDQKPCPSGRYQDEAGQSECKKCPAGYFCPNMAYGGSGRYEGKGSGSGSAGARDDGGVSDYTLYPCSEGGYCPAGTAFDGQFLCPNGTFSNHSMLTHLSECEACSPGRYCNSSGLTAISGLCSEGYYCMSGASPPRPSG